MKKLYIFGMALAAMFAFSTAVVASASAETTLLAEWLINGVGVAASAEWTDPGEFNFGEKGNKRSGVALQPKAC